MSAAAIMLLLLATLGVMGGTVFVVSSIDERPKEAKTVATGVGAASTVLLLATLLVAQLTASSSRPSPTSPSSGVAAAASATPTATSALQAAAATETAAAQSTAFASAVATTPVATATQTPSSQPTPRAGTVICQTSASTGWSGWTISGSWKLLNGVLLNDGTVRTGPEAPTLVPPSSCQPTANDYAVEITAQVVSNSDYYGFGIDVRGISTATGWQGYGGYEEGSFEVKLDDIGNSGLASQNYSVGQDPHIYRIEVKGNTISFLVDGAKLLTATDNKYLSAGQVGIWCAEVQIQMTSFRLIAL